MTNPMRTQTVSAATVLLLLVAAPVTGWAEDEDGDGEEIPFDVAELFFELNDTDGDLGIHGLIDGEAWKRLKIEDPRERTMLDARILGRLRRQGLTEFFFESAEPSFDELPPEMFFRRFPEGEYEIEGVTLEGEERESTVEISHVLPAPPENIQVSGEGAPEDCDEDPVPEVSTPVVISWDAVTESHPDLGEEGDIEVAKYELVVEREEPETLVLAVDLPPDVTEFEVPEDFTDLDSGDGFKFEILVRLENGNRTAVESCFELE